MQGVAARDEVLIDYWIKSTYSGEPDIGTCVEVGPCARESVIGVRDSKNRLGGQLIFSGIAWASFTAEIRSGNFDLPVS